MNVVFFSVKNKCIFLRLFFQVDRLKCALFHHHLGLLLSQNLGRSKYVDIIVHVSSVCKKLGFLKNFNLRLGERGIQNLYTTFMHVRPDLEYS